MHTIFIMQIRKLKLREKINIYPAGKEPGFKYRSLDTLVILTPEPMFSYSLMLPLIIYKLYSIGSIALSAITWVWFAFVYLFVYYLFTIIAFGMQQNLADWLRKISDLFPNCPGCEQPKSWILFGCLSASFSTICSRNLSLIRTSLGFYKEGKMHWWDYRSIAVPQDT